MPYQQTEADLSVMESNLFKYFVIITIAGALLLVLSVILFFRNFKKATAETYGIMEPEDIMNVSEKDIRGPLVPKSITPVGVCAFFPFFGLAAICADRVGLAAIPTILIGIMIGIAALISASVLVYVVRLKNDPSAVFVPNTAGATGKVIRDIPAAQNGRGVIREYTNNQVVQFEAVSLDEVTLTKGTSVKVLHADTDKVAVVERIIQK
jgi:TM2 domain-containing membrane protein YozV